MRKESGEKGRIETGEGEKQKLKKAPEWGGEVEGWNSENRVEGSLALAELSRRAAGRGAQSELWPGTEQC